MADDHPAMLTLTADADERFFVGSVVSSPITDRKPKKRVMNFVALLPTVLRCCGRNRTPQA